MVRYRSFWLAVALVLGMPATSTAGTTPAATSAAADPTTTAAPVTNPTATSAAADPTTTAAPATNPASASTTTNLRTAAIGCENKLSLAKCEALLLLELCDTKPGQCERTCDDCPSTTTTRESTVAATTPDSPDSPATTPDSPDSPATTPDSADELSIVVTTTSAIEDEDVETNAVAVIVVIGLMLAIIGALLGYLCFKKTLKRVAQAKKEKEEAEAEKREPTTRRDNPKKADTFWSEIEDDSDLDFVRRSHYNINLPRDPLQVPPLPMGQRTFTTSNYRNIYQNARNFADANELLVATKHLVRSYIRKQTSRRKVSDSSDISSASVEEETELKTMEDGRMFYDAWVTQASKDTSVWHNVSDSAELLWASGKNAGEIEFCNIINAAIRDDDPLDLIHLVMVTRGIDGCGLTTRFAGSMMDHRFRGEQIQKFWALKFPKDGILHRGGAFHDSDRDFFVPGQKYRVPGYVSTSVSKKVAMSFALRAPKKGLSRVLWRVQVDKRAISDPRYRCRHAVVMEKNQHPGEEEYLFVPFSIFTVTEAKWSVKATEPHQITLTAATDILDDGDRELPLAPWY